MTFLKLPSYLGALTKHPYGAVAGAALGGFGGHWVYDTYVAPELRRQWAGERYAK